MIRRSFYYFKNFLYFCPADSFFRQKKIIHLKYFSTVWKLLYTIRNIVWVILVTSILDLYVGSTPLIKYWPGINTFLLNSLKTLSPNFVSNIEKIHWHGICALVWSLCDKKLKKKYFFYLCACNLKFRLKVIKEEKKQKKSFSVNSLNFVHQ